MTLCLIAAISSILDYQLKIIERNGGVVEQFVGDCIIAYWLPAKVEQLVGTVREVATEIAREKVNVQDLEFGLRLGFSVADMAGAYFGRAPNQRFQVIGKARDRADRLSRFSPPGNWLITDADTLALMPEAVRAEFVQVNQARFSLRLP